MWLNNGGFGYKGMVTAASERIPLKEFGSFELSISEKRIGLKVGKGRCGQAFENVIAGNVILSGAEHGNKYTKIILTGQIDSDWAKQFFAE